MEILHVGKNLERLPPLYRNLRLKGSATDGSDRFVAEGEKVVGRALSSDFEIPSIVLTPDHYARLSDDLQKRRPALARVYVIEKSVLDQAVGFRLRQGILAESCRPLPSPDSEWVRGLPENHVLVALDGLSDAENVGAVVRNALAFGLDGLVTDARSPSPYLRRAVRVSMGAAFFLPIQPVSSLADTLARLKARRQSRLVAATTDENATPLGSLSETSKRILVLGSEKDGPSPAVLELCDERIRIPMAQEWISLNVAAASAVLFHALTRDRLPAGG